MDGLQRIIVALATLGSIGLSLFFAFPEAPDDEGFQIIIDPWASEEGQDPVFELRGRAVGREGTRMLSYNDTVAPKETVALTVDSRARGWAAVVFVDTEGRADLVFPRKSREPAKLPRMRIPQELDAGARMPDASGDVRFIGVRCPEPFTLNQLERALRKVDPGEPVPELLPTCRQSVLPLRIEAEA